MKKLVCLLSILIVSICFVGCTPHKNKNVDIGAEIMKLEIGTYSFDVELEKTETVKALIELLPLNINMSELNGNEKYYYLNTSLPMASKRVGRIETGDIMLWGDDCLVIFYKSFSTPYSYTKIGHIKNTDNLQTAVGTGSVHVTWLSK